MTKQKTSQAPTTWKFPSPSKKWKLDRNNVLWHLEIPNVSDNTTEIPEQKLATNWTQNDQAKDKTKSSPNQVN